MAILKSSKLGRANTRPPLAGRGKKMPNQFIFSLMVPAFDETVADIRALRDSGLLTTGSLGCKCDSNEMIFWTSVS
jgi:hypothetical protein